MSEMVPKVRFQGFTDDWEQRKLGDVFDIVTDYVANGSFETLRNNVRSYTGENFAYMIRLQDASNNWSGPWLYTDQKGYSFLSKSKLNPNDIIMSNVGSVGKFFLVPNLDKPMTLAPNAVLIKSSKNKNTFLYQMMIGETMQSKISKKTTPGVQSKINKTDFKKITTTIPNVVEQEKIGSFFGKLDNLITLHQRKLDLLKEQKKGFLQKMFPKSDQLVPEVRFSGFTDDWEQRKLGEIANFSKGSGYAKNDLVEFGDPIILYGRLYTNYETIIETVDTFVNRKDKSIISEGNEVVVPASGESSEDISRASVVGRAGLILGGDLNIIKPEKFIDSVFLALTISNGSQQKEMSKRAQGKSVVHLHNSDLKQVDLLYPKLEEQKKIGTLFKQLDNLITLHQRKLDLLKEHKKGYLQKMFV